MNYLKNIWVRVIVSLFGGGLTSELIHISTGDPNRPMTTNLSLLFALVVFIILTQVVRKYDDSRLR